MAKRKGPNSSSQMNLFHLDGGRPSFEDLGRDNGGRFWYATDLMRMLGYESFQTFQKPINKALATCTALNIPVLENIRQVEREVDGQVIQDYKLSRFACYLISINGDVRKREVAEAQAYFVTMAEAFRQYLQGAENVERLQTRDKITEQEVALASTACNAGVTQYQFFQDSGYRGMYNMHLGQLRLKKNVPMNRSPLDFMGAQELAGNLFRITQTNAKIQNEKLRGDRALQDAAHQVGRTVRKTMIELSGTAPENLPPSEDMRTVRRDLKRTGKEFEKIDGGKRKKLPPALPQLPAPNFAKKDGDSIRAELVRLGATAEESQDCWELIREGTVPSGDRLDSTALSVTLNWYRRRKAEG